MDLLNLYDIKQEGGGVDTEDEGEYYSLAFEVKVKVENASPSYDEIDWCVENSSLFGNNNYINLYDDLIEYSEQRCLICHKKFDSLYALYQHNICHMTINLITNLGSFQHQCKNCNTFFPGADKLNAHRIKCEKPSINLSGINMRTCNECGKVLPYKSWHSHIREVHCFDKVVCQMCNKLFKCQRYLRRHVMFVHEGNKPSWRFHNVLDEDVECKCNFCPAILRNKHALKTHINNCHSSEECWCDICKKKFKSKPYLRIHMYRVHDGDGRKYFCQCGKSYKSPRRLRNHKRNTVCGDL